MVLLWRAPAHVVHVLGKLFLDWGSRWELMLDFMGADERWELLGATGSYWDLMEAGVRVVGAFFSLESWP